MKTLIIAEKPSVGRDIAGALDGVFQKRALADLSAKAKGGKDDPTFLESDEYVITWAVGHLVQLAEPDEDRLTDTRSHRRFEFHVRPVASEVDLAGSPERGPLSHKPSTSFSQVWMAAVREPEILNDVLPHSSGRDQKPWRRRCKAPSGSHAEVCGADALVLQ